MVAGIIISVIALIISTIFNILATRKNGKEEREKHENAIREQTKRDTTINIKLDDISNGIGEVRKDNIELKKDVSSISVRQTLLETRVGSVETIVNNHINNHTEG